MNRKISLISVNFFFLFFSVIPLIAIALTTSEIQNAIQRGIRTKKDRHHGLNLEDQTANVLNGLINMNRPTYAWRQEKGFTVELFTPITWIEQMAADAARDYKEFTLADVTDDMKRPVLFVLVYGRQGKDYEHIFGESVHHVVLRSEDKQLVVQPNEIRSFTDEQQNLFGAKQEYVGKTVTFNLVDVERLRSKSTDGEFFLTVVGENSEKSFKIKRKHFAGLPMPENITADFAKQPSHENNAVRIEKNTDKQGSAVEAQAVNASTSVSSSMPAAPTEAAAAAGELSKVQLGMSPDQVSSILGKPIESNKWLGNDGLLYTQRTYMIEGQRVRMKFKADRLQIIQEY